MVKMETRRRYSLVVMSLIVLPDCIFICFPWWTYCSLPKYQNVFYHWPIIAQLYSDFLYIHWPIKLIKKCFSFPLNVIVLCLVIFSPALSSPMLYCSIIPRWPQLRLAVLFFSALLVCWSLLSSLISCVEGGISCLFWPRWCFGPELRELLQMGESQTLFLSSPQLPQSTAGHHFPLHLSYYTSHFSVPFFTFLHVPVLSVLSVLSTDLPLTYSCSSTAKPHEDNHSFMTLPVSLFNVIHSWSLVWHPGDHR